MSITAIASILVGPFTELIGKFVQDKDKAAQLAHELSTLADTNLHEVNLAQIGVNKVEAKSPSLFVSGWRPACGWVAVVALANNYMIVPYAKAFGVDVVSLDLGQLMPVLLGMLGLTAARSFEKAKGVARTS